MPLLVCAVVLVVLALGSALAFPLELTMRSYAELADVLLRGSLLRDSFLPVGYAAFVAIGAKLNASRGLALMQAGTYLVAVWLAWTFVRERLKGSPAWLVWLVLCLVAFHPYMLINIHRVNDNAINVCLMLVLWAWVRQQQVQDTFDLGGCMLAGSAFGVFLLSRPNGLSLAPVLLLTVFMNAGTPGDRFKSLGAFVITAAVWYGLLAWLITGAVSFWPQNGPYNLYAGNNPFSNATLLTMGNGEPSLDLALKDKGMLLPGQPAYEVSPSLLKNLAYQHIQEHPADFVRGIFIKAWVMLGPDLRQAHSLPKAMVQWALVWPTIMWAIMLIRSARVSWRKTDWLPALFIGSYLAPFLVLNADARLRTPLVDVLFLLHAAALYADQRRAAHRGLVRRV